MDKIIKIVKPLNPDLDLFNGYLRFVIESGIYSNNGHAVTYLENELIKFLKVKYGAVFCNGTIALMIALKALGLKGKVITTPFTFPATVNVLEWCGLEPVFADIDYNTLNINSNRCEDAIDNEISAILPVHVFGNPCNVTELDVLALSYDLKIIYDAAHAFAVEIDDSGIGNYGDVSMFSFHPTKLFHTAEGGMLTYEDPELGIRIKRLRNFGIKNDEIGCIESGINGKMNELSAIMGLCILPKINNEIEKRKEKYNLYVECLKDIEWINIIKQQDIKNNYQYFPIRVIGKSRNDIYDILRNKGILTRKYFYPLCSDFPQFKKYNAYVPNAKKVSEEILCLPFYGDLEVNDILKICEILRGLK